MGFTQYPCNRCEQTFTDKLELVMHFWLTHGLTLVEAQRETDRKNYCGVDSGCKEASDFLGYPSSCKSCPFPKCIFDDPKLRKKYSDKTVRNKNIRRLYQKGAKVEDIATIYNLHTRTVQRVISKARKVENELAT